MLVFSNLAYFRSKYFFLKEVRLLVPIYSSSVSVFLLPPLSNFLLQNIEENTYNNITQNTLFTLQLCYLIVVYFMRYVDERT